MKSSMNATVQLNYSRREKFLFRSLNEGEQPHAFGAHLHGVELIMVPFDCQQKNGTRKPNIRSKEKTKQQPVRKEMKTNAYVAPSSISGFRFHISLARIHIFYPPFGPRVRFYFILFACFILRMVR